MAINNVCKNCGGELIYDAICGELKCNKCSSITDIPEQNIKLEKKQLTDSSTIKTSKTKYVQYHCATCGRNHIVPTDSELYNCPSCCDSNLTKTINVEYMPDGIIPFSLNKEGAKKSFKSWIRTKRFTPNKLSEKASNYSFNGLYLPVFLYNFDCYSEYSGDGIIETTTHMPNQKGGSTPIMHYYRERFSGSREDTFINYIDTATSLISTETFKKIANYNYENICVYRPEFLYGWIGSEVDIPLQKSVERTKNFIKNEIKYRAEYQPKYNRVENFVCTTTFTKNEFNYLYLPIYNCNYKFKNKTYNFYINGVTGKTYGKTPKSKVKIASLMLAILGIVGVLAFLIIKYFL